jgi:hypothetical protein
MAPRKVKITEDLRSFYVVYVERQKYQRYMAAQFSKSMRDLQGVKDWIAAKPQLVLESND